MNKYTKIIQDEKAEIEAVREEERLASERMAQEQKKKSVEVIKLFVDIVYQEVEEAVTALNSEGVRSEMIKKADKSDYYCKLIIPDSTLYSIEFKVDENCVRNGLFFKVGNVFNETQTDISYRIIPANQESVKKEIADFIKKALPTIK